MLSIDDRRLGETCPTPFNAAVEILHGAGAPDARIALSVLSPSGSERWSYGKLRSAVAGAASRLRDEGLCEGDVLLLRLGHSPRFPIAFLAALWAGIIPVATSDALTSGEIARLADVVEPDATLAEPSISIPLKSGRLLDANLFDTPAAEPMKAVLGDPERLGYMLCTSGTSGNPKLVRHAHRALWARNYMRAGWTGISAQDRILHAGAFNWSYTFGTGLVDPWSVGGTALVTAAHVPITMLPLLAKRHDATILAAVPGVFRKLLRNGVPPLPKLRYALSAGEALPASIRRSWREATGTDIHEAFGQTECSTFVSGSAKRPAPECSVGYAQSGRAVAILRDGQPVPRGSEGEIAISCDDPALCLGDQTEIGDWFGTGDLGRMADDGAITYLGRADDVLTAGGYRISPLEIEDVFSAHPHIEASVAVDYKLAEDTTLIALFYTGKPDITPDALKSFADGKLAPYKIPRIFRHVDALPTGRNGKLLRHALRAARDPEP